MARDWTNLLPWYQRTFDIERDIKEWKKFVVNKERVFPVETSFIQANTDFWWMPNLDKIRILPWDIISITEIEKEGENWEQWKYLTFYHKPAQEVRLPHTYRVEFSNFLDVFYNIPIQVIKERKIEKLSTQTQEEVNDVINKDPLELEQGGEYKVKKEWFLLPVKWKNNRYKKESFLFNKGDIILIKEMKPKKAKVLLEITSWDQRTEVLCSLKDLELYTKWALKRISKEKQDGWEKDVSFPSKELQIDDILSINDTVDGVKLWKVKVVEIHTKFIVVQLLDKDETPITGKRMKL